MNYLDNPEPLGSQEYIININSTQNQLNRLFLGSNSERDKSEDKESISSSSSELENNKIRKSIDSPLELDIVVENSEKADSESESKSESESIVSGILHLGFYIYFRIFGYRGCKYCT